MIQNNMKKKIVWTTAEGQPLTLKEITDLHLVNICKHILLRVELALDEVDFYNSPYTPTGDIAKKQNEANQAYRAAEAIALIKQIQLLNKEVEKRKLTIPTKVHVNKWL